MFTRRKIDIWAISVNPLMGTGNYSAASNNKLVHWPLMGGLLHGEEETGRGRSPPRPLLAVPNVTAHPSTATVPVTVLLYNGPLLCLRLCFNVPIKGLSLFQTPHVRCCADRVFYSRLLFQVYLVNIELQKLLYNTCAEKKTSHHTCGSHGLSSQEGPNDV